MAKETKVGLLAGLAFIICFAVILTNKGSDASAVPTPSVLSDAGSRVPAAIRKAVHPDPDKRYAELSEFVHDLHHPNPEFLRTRRPPLLERNPVAFWKGVALMLAVAVLVLAGVLALR